MRLSIATPAAWLPVTLAEAKLQCRVDLDDDNDLIMDYIGTATERCELAARRTFINTTYDLYLDAWPARSFTLPRPPLVSVTGIYYTDSSAVETEWASSNYLVDVHGEPGRIAYKMTAVPPSVVFQEINAVRVRFVAGYGAATSDVPQRYRQAIKLLVGHYYENREAVTTVGGAANELPMAVRDLLGLDRGGFF